VYWVKIPVGIALESEPAGEDKAEVGRVRGGEFNASRRQLERLIRKDESFLAAGCSTPEVVGRGLIQHGDVDFLAAAIGNVDGNINARSDRAHQSVTSSVTSYVASDGGEVRHGLRIKSKLYKEAIGSHEYVNVLSKMEPFMRCVISVQNDVMKPMCELQHAHAAQGERRRKDLRRWRPSSSAAATTGRLASGSSGTHP